MATSSQDTPDLEKKAVLIGRLAEPSGTAAATTSAQDERAMDRGDAAEAERRLADPNTRLKPFNPSR